MERSKPQAHARRISLTDDEREVLRELTASGTTPSRVFKRARVLKLLDEGWAPRDVPGAVGCGEATMRRTRQKYEAGGLERALYDQPRGAKEPALDDRQRAQVVAMVCGPPPQGRARWTVRLIAEQAVKRGIADTVGRETVRVLLRDHELKPWREKNVVRRRAR